MLPFVPYCSFAAPLCSRLKWPCSFLRTKTTISDAELRLHITYRSALSESKLFSSYLSYYLEKKSGTSSVLFAYFNQLRQSLQHPSFYFHPVTSTPMFTTYPRYISLSAYRCYTLFENHTLWNLEERYFAVKDTFNHFYYSTRHSRPQLLYNLELTFQSAPRSFIRQLPLQRPSQPCLARPTTFLHRK